MCESKYQIKICDSCHTSSWQPCPPDTPSCVGDNNGGWMVCGYCQYKQQVDRLQQAILPVIEQAELDEAISPQRYDLADKKIYEVILTKEEVEALKREAINL